MTKKKTKSTVKSIKPPDVALVFNVTRQAVHKWKRDNGELYKTFTAGDIDSIIEERQSELSGIKARWELLKTLLGDA